MMGKGCCNCLLAWVSVVRIFSQRTAAWTCRCYLATTASLSLFFAILAGPNRATVVCVLHRFVARNKKKNKLNKKLLESGARTLRGLAVNTAERALACNYCATEARILCLI